jgi:two-component system, OmpR family, sensor kinase
VSRVALRWRLALAFAGAMAVVLVVVGSLLYVRLGESLLEQVDDNLETASLGLAVAVTGGTNLDNAQYSVEDGFMQVLRRGETVWSAPPNVSPKVTDAETERAADGPFSVTRDGHRVLVRAVGDATLVVGASLEDREEALDGLLAQLLLIGPLALLLTSVGGYFLAGAALRPVEAMRRQATEISSERAGDRLPVPPADDEIRRLGLTLNELLGRLEAGLARERRFVADASHELRTPLASLRAELELARRRPRSAEELQDAVRSAAEEVERLVRLAEDLLVLTRADEGRLPLALDPLTVRELLDAVAGRFDTRAREVGRRIEVEAPVDAVTTADRLRLEQALGNLVDNALRHGGGTVRLAGGVENGNAELRVSDEGAGFPPDFLPHAFERFSRVDVARSGGGTGLGLAIVDAIVRAHGGSAAAANGRGGGAEVTISIPAHRALI